MVIGADGVHSSVRQPMRSLALKDCPTSDVDDKKPFMATYRVLFGSSPKTDDFIEGRLYETHGSGGSTQCHVGRERV